MSMSSLRTIQWKRSSGLLDKARFIHHANVSGSGIISVRSRPAQAGSNLSMYVSISCRPIPSRPRKCYAHGRRPILPYFQLPRDYFEGSDGPEVVSGMEQTYYHERS